MGKTLSRKTAVFHQADTPVVRSVAGAHNLVLALAVLAIDPAPSNVHPSDRHGRLKLVSSVAVSDWIASQVMERIGFTGGSTRSRRPGISRASPPPAFS